MAAETPKTRKTIIVPRGLSQHGLPKTPGPVSPDGSVRSYRFGSSSPPLSPRSFMSLFRPEDPPRPHSDYSTLSTSFRDSSFPSTPQFPPVAETRVVLKDDIDSKLCPNCGACSGYVLSEPAGLSKEITHLETSHQSHTLSRLAHRIKVVLVARRKEESLERRRLQPSEPTLQKVEATHWTEM